MRNRGLSNLPPGVTNRMIEEAAGGNGPCQCCGNDPADCICPECPVCSEYGNPNCYTNARHYDTQVEVLVDSEDWHKLTYNREQLIGQAKLRIYNLRLRLSDEEDELARLQNSCPNCEGAGCSSCTPDDEPDGDDYTDRAEWKSRL